MFYIISLNTIFDELNEKVFSQDLASKQQLNLEILNSFMDFLNENANKCAEMYSKYLNEHLEISNMKKFNEGEIQSVLDKDFQLFRLITARDIFLEFYNQRLLKRLMLREQISLEMEKYMLEKFKNENGEEYIKNSETIIMNYTNSIEFCETFHKDTDNRFNGDI